MIYEQSNQSAVKFHPNEPSVTYWAPTPDDAKGLINTYLYQGKKARALHGNAIQLAGNREQLSATIEQTTRENHNLKVWQYIFYPGQSIEPPTANAWGRQFAKYINSRWRDTSSIFGTPGPNAFNPLLSGLELIANNHGQFDLNNSLTFSYFMEFLTEYPERAVAWRAFEAANGTTRMLQA